MFENPLPVMENETYRLKHAPSKAIKNHEKNLIQGAFEHVCIFENPLPVIENETYTLTIHAQLSLKSLTKLISGGSSLCMYV